MKCYLQFTYSRQTRELFRKGILWRTWVGRYPQLFDNDDVRIQKNQPDGHFVEWLAAVLLYESTGYCSLIEKYGSKSHPRKISPYVTRVPEGVRDYLDDLDGGHPDLFVFNPDGDDWFFCEVKGHTDRVRERQVHCWHDLERMTGHDVRLLRFFCHEA